MRQGLSTVCARVSNTADAKVQPVWPHPSTSMGQRIEVLRRAGFVVGSDSLRMPARTLQQDTGKGICG